MEIHGKKRDTHGRRLARPRVWVHQWLLAKLKLQTVMKPWWLQGTSNQQARTMQQVFCLPRDTRLPDRVPFEGKVAMRQKVRWIALQARLKESPRRTI